MQTRVDRDRQSAILNQNITQLEQAIQQIRSQEADLKAKLAETRVTLRYQQLKSPVDGVVFDLKPTSTGFTAQSTQTVMKVVPYGFARGESWGSEQQDRFRQTASGCRRPTGLSAGSLDLHGCGYQH